MTEHQDAKPKRVVQEKYVFYQKESCVGMVKQSNIAQVHKKKRKHVFKQYDGLVT